MVAKAIFKTAAKRKAKAKTKPKPKFKAKRTLSKEVEDKLKKQEAEAKAADIAKAKGEKPKAAKPDTKKKTKKLIDITKEKPAKKAEPSKRKKTQDETFKPVGNVERVRKDPPKDPAKRKQSYKEQQRAAIGKERVIGGKAGRKGGMGQMTSYTSKLRADEIVEAGKKLRSGKITQAEYDKIIAAIKKADKEELQRDVLKKARAKDVKDLPNPFKDKKIPEFYMGGSVAKPRTGHMDMRKGGMFKKVK